MSSERNYLHWHVKFIRNELFYIFVKMSKNIEITLDEHCSKAIENALTTGKYDSANAVVHEAIALFEKKQAEDMLTSELQKGIDSGIVKNFNFKEWLEEKNKTHSA